MVTVEASQMTIRLIYFTTQSFPYGRGLLVRQRFERGVQCPRSKGSDRTERRHVRLGRGSTIGARSVPASRAPPARGPRLAYAAGQAGAARAGPSLPRAPPAQARRAARR